MEKCPVRKIDNFKNSLTYSAGPNYKYSSSSKKSRSFRWVLRDHEAAAMDKVKAFNVGNGAG